MEPGFSLAGEPIVYQKQRAAAVDLKRMKGTDPYNRYRRKWLVISRLNQMQETERQWAMVMNNSWKISDWNGIRNDINNSKCIHC